MTNSSFGKGMALGLILALAIALGIVAYPELSKKKDSVEQQTPVTTIATTETEEEETPVASLTGAIGPEKHQWDYYYDYPSKTISIVDQFVGGSDGWGDGYAMHYAGAIDGLCWSTAIKEHPLSIILLSQAPVKYMEPIPLPILIPTSKIIASRWKTSG